MSSYDRDRSWVRDSLFSAEPVRLADMVFPKLLRELPLAPVSGTHTHATNHRPTDPENTVSDIVNMESVRRVSRRKRGGGLTNSALLDAATQYVSLKEQATLISKRVSEMRDRLVEFVEKHGYSDDQGHGWLDLPEQVDGIEAIQRQKRVSRTMDEDKLFALLEDKDLLDDCTTMVRVVDEEKVYKAVYKGQLSEDELNGCVNEKVTYALVLKKP